MLDAARLRGRLIAAVPVPFDRDGRLDGRAQRRYVEHLAGRPVDGVAVWAHTGRGLRISDEQRTDVLTDWKAGLPADRLVFAAAGAPPGVNDPGEVIASARRMADRAADLGAHAILVHPPTAFRGCPGEDRLVIEYHDALAGAGLPLVLFYLYEAAGGLSYRPGVLRELLARSAVLGIKVATLDSVVTYQDIAQLVLDSFPGKVLVTGEDRFLGYSLMCGAEAALVGMASAWSERQAALLGSYWSGDTGRFLRLNGAVDAFARRTFRAPMEGYVQRMLWCLVHEGVIPRASAYDPWAPDLPSDEFDRLGELITHLNRE
jgi:4-hydroxy-tetrahydrodipicolinate synthase